MNTGKFENKLRNRLEELKSRRQKSRDRHQRRVFNSYPSKDKPRVRYITVMNIIYALVIVLPVFNLLGYLYFFTAGVYVDAFASLGSDPSIVQIDITPQWVHSIWLIGPLLNAPLAWLENLINGFETSSLGLIGLCIYLVLQTGELIPTVIWESPEIMWWLIMSFKSHRKIPYSKEDNTVIKKMKVQHNEYYDSFLNSMEDFRQVCYFVDVAICFFLIPFVRVEWTTDGWVLERFLPAASKLTFGLADLDPLATTRMLCSLFLLWVAVKFAMRLTRGFKFFAHKPEVKNV